MKNKVLLCFLILFTFYSCAQKNEYVIVIGTWEMLNILNIENNQIDIGELVLENNKSSELDSIKRAREAEEKKDPRLTKWYYVFNQNYFYEYRLGVGWRFESKIIKNNIYKFDKPFYEILSLKGDTLEIKEHLSKKSLLLKRVNTNLDGLEIISEH